MIGSDSLLKLYHPRPVRSPCPELLSFIQREQVLFYSEKVLSASQREKAILHPSGGDASQKLAGRVNSRKKLGEKLGLRQMASTEQDQADIPTVDLVNVLNSPNVLAPSVARCTNPMAPAHIMTLISSDESIQVGSMNTQLQEELLASDTDF